VHITTEAADNTMVSAAMAPMWFPLLSLLCHIPVLVNDRVGRDHYVPPAVLAKGLAEGGVLELWLLLMFCSQEYMQLKESMYWEEALVPTVTSPLGAHHKRGSRGTLFSTR
jgi:hypothetical protein